MAPDGVSTCRSKNAKGESVEKVYDYVIACSSLKGKISQMKAVEDFESRPRKAVTFVGQRGEDRQEWREQRVPKVLPGYSGRRLPGRSTEEKGREEREEDKGSGERRVRNEIIKEVIKGLKTKERELEGKTSCKEGIASRVKMKKRRKAGQKATKW